MVCHLDRVNGEVISSDLVHREILNSNENRNSKFNTPNRWNIRIENTMHNQVKSPSDTTIYAPGLAKVQSPVMNQEVVARRLTSADNDQNKSNSRNEFQRGVNSEADVINKITLFLDNMRLESGGNETHREQMFTAQQPAPQAAPGPSRMMGGDNSDEVDVVPGQGQGGLVAQQMIINAEKFRAAIDQPNGKEISCFPQQTIDDEFFHLTCHVDVNLIPKIERGEFVELEKLLPCNPTCRGGGDNRLELVNKDGYTYFVPASDRELGKIKSVRKWEQAFRVYAAIYSRANPHRAAEIWQYVYIGNLAASSYSWDNVACYDFAFRHLMSKHPERSWSTIFQQMWSPSMRDPVGRTGVNWGGTASSASSQGRGNKSHRDNYCWKFNKNRCKFGTKCKFDHCCYYCDAYGHGLFNCPRKSARSRDKGSRFEKFDDNRKHGRQNHQDDTNRPGGGGSQHAAASRG